MVRLKFSLKTLHKDLAKVTRSSSFGESLKERLKRGYQKHKKAIHIGLGVAGAVGTAAVAHHYLKKNKKELKEAEREVKKAENEVKKAENEVNKAENEVNNTEHKVKRAENQVKKAEANREVNNTENDAINSEEAKRKEEEAKRKEDEARREAEQANRQAEEAKRKEEEARDRAEKARYQEEEAQRLIKEDNWDNYETILEKLKQERMDRLNQLIKNNATFEELLLDAQINIKKCEAARSNREKDPEYNSYTSNRKKFINKLLDDIENESIEQITTTQLKIENEWNTVYKPKLEEHKKLRMDKWKQLKANTPLNELLSYAENRKNRAQKDLNSFDKNNTRKMTLNEEMFIRQNFEDRILEASEQIVEIKQKMKLSFGKRIRRRR